jgi:hypothetical protein
MRRTSVRRAERPLERAGRWLEPPGNRRPRGMTVSPATANRIRPIDPLHFLHRGCADAQAPAPIPLVLTSALCATLRTWCCLPALPGVTRVARHARRRCAVRHGDDTVHRRLPLALLPIYFDCGS